MPTPIVTFTSDFGSRDWFAGVVHGVIHGIAPNARVVDLTHEIPPGDLRRAAFLLEAATPDFPPGAVHLAVVDPGVGTSRRALAVAARGQFFVGPDNGVLEWALADPRAEIRSLTEEQFFRLPVSRTFHGRDVFAPVAAHLARGVALASLGPALHDPVRLERRVAPQREGELAGFVCWVDRFGNALTDVTAESLAAAFPGVPEARLAVSFLDRRITGITRSYGDAPFGTLLAIVGSSGRLEIAAVGGDAAVRYGLGEGDAIRVRAL